MTVLRKQTLYPENKLEIICGIKISEQEKIHTKYFFGNTHIQFTQHTLIEIYSMLGIRLKGLERLTVLEFCCEELGIQKPGNFHKPSN